MEERSIPHIKDRHHCFCNICRGELCIAARGRAAIMKHLNTIKHKQSLEVTFFLTSNYSEDENRLAVIGGILTFQTTIHNQSFRSMDCTTKLLKNVYNAKYSCTRTK